MSISLAVWHTANIPFQLTVTIVHLQLKPHSPTRLALPPPPPPPLPLFNLPPSPYLRLRHHPLPCSAFPNHQSRRCREQDGYDGTRNEKKLTSITTCRKAMRAETTLQFGGLKSLPHKYIKLKLVCYYSLAIFLQGDDLRLGKYSSLAILLIVLLRASKVALAITPYCIMIIDLSSRFGAMA
jgi:hypothetical protein